MTGTPKRVDRYGWQHAIASQHGPAAATTRLILLVISLHMDPAGENAWPSQTTIAKRAAITVRSVSKHIQEAASDGWLGISWAGRNGQGWRLTRYHAVVPEAVYATLPEKPWEKDPSWRRSERTSAPSGCEGDEPPSPPRGSGSEGGERGGSEVANLAPKRGEPRAEGGERGSYESSLLNLPQKSTHTQEGARRTARAIGSGQILESNPEIQRRRREAAAIVESLAARARR